MANAAPSKVRKPTGSRPTKAAAPTKGKPKNKPTRKPTPKTPKSKPSRKPSPAKPSAAKPSSKRPASAAATHKVTVAAAGTHEFVPVITRAKAGDVVEFEFYPLNHSVVRAEFGFPCVPYEDTGDGKIGFFSGFQPVSEVEDKPPTWSVRINDTDPIFFYCSASGSCTDYGMVGAINPNISTPLDKQQELAKSSDYMLQPGDEFPAEASSSIASLGGLPTEPAMTTPNTPSSSNIGGGAIAGIVIGVLIFVAILAAMFFYIGRSLSLKQVLDRDRERNSKNVSSHSRTPGGPDMYENTRVTFPPSRYPQQPHDAHHNPSFSYHDFPPNYHQSVDRGVLTYGSSPLSQPADVGTMVVELQSPNGTLSPQTPPPDPVELPTDTKF